MMKTAKIATTAAASLFGVAIAASGAYAATGALTVPDTPGHALHTSGVHASGTAAAHAQDAAKVRPGVTVSGGAKADAKADSQASDAGGSTSGQAGVNGDVTGSTSGSTDSTGNSVSGSTDASASGSTQSGSTQSASTQSDAGSAAVDNSSQVQVVAPDAAISLDLGGTTSIHLGH